ncbi:protein-L-isoaspartate(D-aspartate) O-methyltransferase [Verrucomicrobiaceae bacterium N1E253]|uniref:Protein-L-isoaspartate O-methyltransferase n=1 Tax=Oceaniferula marina TaxID=2748318 RepID=A0A851GE07_9BACT|nr:protein-L-isoaspartate(D-aspartate) O-methyltransferase [Oceaniferula marina]NWK55389.1 protein-L-isoaspartate(D-aspartate) O-methyltransferase [Oceaniferula marina]
MIKRQLQDRGIHDPLVLEAMRTTPRESFLPKELTGQAYEDRPLPIGHGQTISQPYIVALMLQLAQITPESRVLDVGTGCGYMAAVVAGISPHVCTIETIPELTQAAMQHFQTLGISHIDARTGDAKLGWPEDKSFDAILVSCASHQAPEALLRQLKPNGHLIIPISGTHPYQTLTDYQRKPDGSLSHSNHIPVRFVPMV